MGITVGTNTDANNFLDAAQILLVLKLTLL
jgi:hypothetical protein